MKEEREKLSDNLMPVVVSFYNWFRQIKETQGDIEHKKTFKKKEVETSIGRAVMKWDKYETTFNVKLYEEGEKNIYVTEARKKEVVEMMTNTRRINIKFYKSFFGIKQIRYSINGPPNLDKGLPKEEMSLQYFLSEDLVINFQYRNVLFDNDGVSIPFEQSVKNNTIRREIIPFALKTFGDWIF